MRFGAGIEHGDIPIVGDWSGDGTTDVGVVRGNLFLRNGREPIRFGAGIEHGDIPIVGAWDGGHDQIGIVHDNSFFLRHDDGRVSTIAFGDGFTHGDLPITGRWDGESRSQIGVVRGNVFHLRHADGSVTWKVLVTVRAAGTCPSSGTGPALVATKSVLPGTPRTSSNLTATSCRTATGSRSPSHPRPRPDRA
jgi:hypothetical protein